MMQHAGTDNLIEALPKIAHLLERQLVDLKIVEFVLALQLLGMSYACGTKVDAGDMSRGPADSVSGRLRGAAAGDEYRVVLAVRPCRPEEMEIRATELKVLPSLPIGFEVIYGRRIRIPFVEGLDFHRYPNQPASLPPLINRLLNTSSVIPLKCPPGPASLVKPGYNFVTDMADDATAPLRHLDAAAPTTSRSPALAATR
jgi:hypothetical protein